MSAAELDAFIRKLQGVQEKLAQTGSWKPAKAPLLPVPAGMDAADLARHLQPQFKKPKGENKP